MMSKEHYVVEKILDHKKVDNEYQYLVKWKGYGSEFNSWETVDCFDGLDTISKYWKDRNKKNKKLDKKKQRIC